MADKSCTHIVIDMLADFIYGTMACQNAENAMLHSIAYINAHQQDRIYYVCDCHPKNHCSFISQGGEWPEHCVKNSRGQEIHLSYYTKFVLPALRPHRTRIFLKGCKPEQEEYSGYNAVNSDGIVLHDVLSHNVIVSGIATEYCVLNTVSDLLEAGYDVQVLEDGLGYVDLKEHKVAIEKMRSLGAKII